MKVSLTAIFVLLAGLIHAENPTVGFVDVDGAIGPATSSYLSRAVKKAAEIKSECLIVQLDTPGGLLESTKEIVQVFYQARLPVVVYVAPTGANAGSAGCFITLAADIAVMAPNTSIGAAHPVELGSFGAQKSDDVMTKKIENFAASYIEAIADKRHRNAEWAKSAVRESASITAEQALASKVIDLIAEDVPSLLRQLDGRVINGQVLHTAEAKIVTIPMVARERIFQLLWRPEVLFILMLIAIYGIIGELSNPGAILPGVAGAIALILALYMGAILPLNIAGVALIVLACVLFVTDVFAPTHGVLTAGGLVSFLLGSLLLFEGAGPAFHLSLGMILPATALTGAFFIFIVGAGLRAQRLPVRVGHESMIGQTVAPLTRITADSGKVRIDGEYWNARSDTPIEAGQAAKVVGIHGLTLHVQPETKAPL